MLEVPFTGKDQRVRRRRGLVSVIEWLAAHPGQTWQERWQAAGADALGNAGWWRPSLDLLQACPTITMLLNKVQVQTRYTFGAYSTYYTS